MLDEIIQNLPKNNSNMNAHGIQITGSGDLPSVFEVTELAVSAIAACISQLSEFAMGVDVDLGNMSVDRQLSSHWFRQSVEPIDWALPAKWDALSGNYKTEDGWIRLHTNKPHHRQALLRVLGCKASRDSVEAIVQKQAGVNLETDILDAGGCAANMLSQMQWQTHPQGQAISSEPLIHWRSGGNSNKRHTNVNSKRPLSGLRVLDLTRVLAGPVATRFLSSFGADVLRIDPLHWNESLPTIEMSVGKRRAGLDLNLPESKARLTDLIREADVLVHGYRPDALERMGFGDDARHAINPGLIDVSLSAYGWTGPWACRRGFDSLVQMSCGIADTGMKQMSESVPVALPVQALDHATGYLMAAAVLNALHRRQIDGQVFSARLSLARTAKLLCSFPKTSGNAIIDKPKMSDFMHSPERTDWGLVKRLKYPYTIEHCDSWWDIPAGELRVNDACWAEIYKTSS